MNYRHIYHAGNFADVFKHSILAICLEKFHEKEAPFFVLDTHAGIAKYDLSDEKSRKTFEAENGIKKILKDKNFIQILPQNYLKILAKTNCCKVEELPQKLKIYTGSPIVIKYFMRPQDRAVFAELNRDDFFTLKKHFAGNKKFQLLNEDGFHLLKSMLPPKENRGLVIIDPAFEKDQNPISIDYEKTIFFLKEARKRFAHGTYIIWHPIIEKEKQVLDEFYKEIKELKFEKIIHKICEAKNQKEGKMRACGVFIINAPLGVEEKINSLMKLL